MEYLNEKKPFWLIDLESKFENALTELERLNSENSVLKSQLEKANNKLKTAGIENLSTGNENEPSEAMKRFVENLQKEQKGK